MEAFYTHISHAIEKELNKEKINFELFNNKNLDDNQIIMFQEMTKYYLTHKDSEIYKKTDYLCNQKEKICICNTHADDLRKIYDGINYKENVKFISYYNN